MSKNANATLAQLPDRIAAALGRPSLSTCLCVGRPDVFTPALKNVLADSGDGCAVYAIGASGRDSQEPEIRDAYQFAGPAVGVDEFPRLGEVVAFGQSRPNPVDVARAYTQALAAAKRLATARAGLDAVAADFSQTKFDLVVVQGEETLTGRIVQRTLGSKAFLFDGVKTTFGGAAAFAALFNDVAYKLVASDDHEAGGWALFALRDPAESDLPIHFFTIVLNGEPFIRYHEQMLLELDCPWHWHVVEGVASLVKDTAWSVAAGGHIPDDLHRDGKSNDGTTEYLDDLAARFPNRVTLYRKPPGVFWDGKLEMVNAPIPSIREKCLLWQIDSDELWSAEQVATVRRKFIEEPDRTAAFFWCNYYVGPEKGISTRFNYAQNPNQEWLRLWRFEPGMIWDKHEPPTLRGYDAKGVAYDAGRKHPFTHREMERCGAVFDHFAYTTAAQAQFKESYYGYRNAVAQWSALQRHGEGSGLLRDYFAWVSDETMFDSVGHLGWTPLAVVDQATGEWRFRDGPALAEARTAQEARRKIKIVVDGVFFQMANSGIARVWINLMQEWVRSGFADHVVLLDRGGAAPRIEGVVYSTIERHSWDNLLTDAELLQEVCDREGADLFLSTYYTTPTRTPSVFFGHDMIPEILGFDLDDVWWRQKRRAIQFAAGHIMVSNNSAHDMCVAHPEIDRASVLVAHNSVAPVFHPCTPQEVDAFRAKYRLDRPFVMLVGERFGWKGYKNGSVVFAALAQMPRDRRPLLVCVGGAPQLEEVGRAFLDDDEVRLIRLDDAELRCCYGAALAYVCPSSIEGFGLPIAEAMSVGTPALVCRNSSIPEVAGDAGVYIDADDPGTLIEAIESVRDPARRAALISAGRAQAARFDQARSARLIADYCLQTVARVRSGEIRLNTQALHDAFRDAEARRAAEARKSALEKTLFDTKIELSSLSRLNRPTVSIASAAAQEVSPAHAVLIEQNSRHMALVERRLAAAYARLRNLEQASCDAAAAIEPPHAPELAPLDPPPAPEATAPIGYNPVELLESEGLGGVEGPYPQLDIFRSFRWQVAPLSRFTFDCPAEMEAWLEIEFGNVQDEQVVRVFLGDGLIKVVAPPEAGWTHVWRIVLPVTLNAGLVRVRVEAEKFAHIEADQRSLHVAIYKVRLRPRRPGDTTATPVEGVRDLEGVQE